MFRLPPPPPLLFYLPAQLGISAMKRTERTFQLERIRAAQTLSSLCHPSLTRPDVRPSSPCQFPPGLKGRLQHGYHWSIPILPPSSLYYRRADSLPAQEAVLIALRDAIGVREDELPKLPPGASRSDMERCGRRHHNIEAVHHPPHRRRKKGGNPRLHVFPIIAPPSSKLTLSLGVPNKMRGI